MEIASAPVLQPGGSAQLGALIRHFGGLAAGGSGVLAQIWWPTSGSEQQQQQNVTLHTRGLPFCLVGPGEELAVFRTSSLTYTFQTDLQCLDLMGAPGRVFSTGEAETSDNVQLCDARVYHRVGRARECRMTRTMMLPVFADASRSRTCAVLEITPLPDAGMSYESIFGWARASLEAAALFTIQALETQTHEMQSHAQLLGFTYQAAQSSSLLTAGDEGVERVPLGPVAAAQQPQQQEEEQPAGSSEAEPDESLKAIAFRYIW